MNTPKHTPGPWLIQERNNPDWQIESENGLVIATVTMGDSEDRQWTETNAKLIAAAPAMLEALQKMEPIIKAFLEDELSVTTLNEAAEIYASLYRPAIKLTTE